MRGRNIIGRVYKEKVTHSVENGFIIKTKYKSNFGKVSCLEIFFNLNKKNIEIDINADILVEESKNVIIKKNKIIIKNEKKFKLIKPDIYNANKTIGKDKLYKDFKNGLYIPIIKKYTEEEFEVIDFYIIPSIYKEKEYIECLIV